MARNFNDPHRLAIYWRTDRRVFFWPQTMLRRRSTKLLVVALTATSSTALAYDITDEFSLGALVGLGYQCQELASSSPGQDKCKGALPVRPELNWRPSERNEVYVLLGFASGSALNDQGPFNIAPWAADLEEDVEKINGRRDSRDHILEAWYRHEFAPGNSSLGVTIGIIDATGYLDENAYSNDEYTQFMNAALVNGPNVFLPSYDRGVALEWGLGNWELSGVYMNIGENRDGNETDYFGSQLEYTANTGVGEGHYRINYNTTSEDFEVPGTGKLEKRETVFLSLDQALGQTLGVFARLGWQNKDAVVDYDALYSGGLDIRGNRWGRADDNIGIGYAYLDGGNAGFKSTQVFETYYRIVFNEYFALTGDLQYMKDDVIDEANPEGFILGLRAVATF